MKPAYKLHVKIGQAEFDAEGPEEAVKEQFEQFRELVQSTSARPLKDAGQERIGNGGNNDLSPLDPSVRDRAFVERENIVSLRLLPQSENRDADALLLLLYGFRLIKNVHDVPAVQLVQAAKQSGLQVIRVDRILAAHERLITKGGYKRGSRYGLNNQGVKQAEEILREMLS